MEIVHRSFRRGFRRYRYLAATSAREAHELLKEFEVELAVIDLFMPYGNGIELTHEMRHNGYQGWIAIISGMLNTDATVSAMRAGADTVLEKPLKARDILAALDKAPATPEPDFLTIDEAEERHIRRVLAFSEDNVSLAARRLGVHRQALQERLRKLG